jgi:hypothetical protein
MQVRPVFKITVPVQELGGLALQPGSRCLSLTLKPRYGHPAHRAALYSSVSRILHFEEF